MRAIHRASAPSIVDVGVGLPALVVAVLLAGCGSGPASSAGSPSPSLDTCLVGVWRTTSITGVLAAGGAQVHLAGGAGETLTVLRDGSLAVDDRATAPVVGTAPDGTAYQLAQSGAATGRLTAAGGSITVTLDDPADLTTTLSRGGAVVATQHPGAQKATYACSRGASLTITSGGGTVSAYVPAG